MPPDLRPSKTNMPSDRLVQGRNWFLAITETLWLCCRTTILLPWWLEGHTGWQPLYAQRWIKIRPIEGEALAVADALDNARYILYCLLGCSQLLIAVDRKPLLKVLGDRSLENISNSRLRNFKEKTLRYKFHMFHLPGVKHQATDSLSRHPS